ncbi:hypothetical protein RB597_000221 [Gaeumannomyces tritici]
MSSPFPQSQPQPPPPPTHSSADEAVVGRACGDHGLSRAEFDELRRRATAAKATCYAPYSNFRVGACALSEGGGGPEGAASPYISGANVENASYPVGVCAEVTTLSSAVTSGHRRFRALAVATDVAPPASPCGRCRQFIREFCPLDMPIFMFDKNEDFIVMKLEALLPLSFGPENLLPPGAAAATARGSA